MSSPSTRKETEAAQTNLDGLVVNIELTLISIIQGVALYFLTENSRKIFVELQWVFWPYAVTGLCIIFLFWSRSILHTLTVIRWPLEFGHNFLYIACTLLEALTFTQIGNVKNWFGLNIAYSFLIWFLFIWDLKIIRRRIQDSKGPEGNRLFTLVRKDQFINICLLIPGTLLFSVGSFWALGRWPGFFLEKEGHIYLVGFQLLAALIYLIYSVRFFTRLAPLITRTRAEWRDDVIE